MFARRKGLRYEDRARVYLERQGLRCIAHNFRCRLGEIDLIMRDRQTICFVEVKYRGSSDFGGAAYSISSRQRRRLVKTAEYFLLGKRQFADWPLRFDALLIQRQVDGSETLNWITNAFASDE